MSIELNIQEVVDVCHDAAASAGWWTDLSTGKDERFVYFVGKPMAGKQERRLIAEKLALIHSEVSEAMEAVRKDLMDDKLPDRCGLEVELADAVIRIFDLCGALKLDLGGAIASKARYNSTRADHQIANRMAEGGKAF